MIEVYRGEWLESQHFGALALADIDGKLHAAWGDAQLVTFLRSTAKPLQALPVLESGAASSFGFTPKQIALMCASHAGTDDHAHTAASIQAAVGVQESDLLCGTHPPTDPVTAQQLLCAGEAPGPNRHNCSGKHSGMLALARILDAPIADYVDPQHPVQQRILQTLSEMTDLPAEAITLGVDGCSAPVFALPLRNTAMAYARLADPSGLPPARQAACQQIFAAMNAHPEMVAGAGFFDTKLMRTIGGNLISKMGAEGYYGLALAPGALGHGSPALGLALKIADGDAAKRARALAALTALQTLGGLNAAQRQALSGFGPRPITNWRGLRVGDLRPSQAFIEALSNHAS